MRANLSITKFYELKISRKEIRKLIETIKEEKMQINQEIQKMGEELARYKMAYKKLVKIS